MACPRGPSTAILDPGTAELVVLTPSGLTVQAPETPGTVARVLLPLRTQIVRLYTTDEAIRVLLDADPSSEPFSAETTTQAVLFAPGDTVLPGAWYAMLVPLENVPHAVHLTSTGTGGRACAWWPSWHREGRCPMCPTDRYLILRRGQPVWTTHDVLGVVAYLWGRHLRDRYVVLDYERPYPVDTADLVAWSQCLEDTAC